MNFVDVLGTIGVSMLLLAFFLNLRGVLQKESLSYLSLNFLGAGLACIASVLLKYIPFIVLEGAWTLVSGIELSAYLRRKS